MRPGRLQALPYRAALIQGARQIDDPGEHALHFLAARCHCLAFQAADKWRGNLFPIDDVLPQAQRV